MAAALPAHPSESSASLAASWPELLTSPGGWERSTGTLPRASVWVLSLPWQRQSLYVPKWYWEQWSVAEDNLFQLMDHPNMVYWLYYYLAETRHMSITCTQFEGRKRNEHL